MGDRRDYAAGGIVNGLHLAGADNLIATSVQVDTTIQVDTRPAAFVVDLTRFDHVEFADGTLYVWDDLPRDPDKRPVLPDGARPVDGILTVDGNHWIGD